MKGLHCILGLSEDSTERPNNPVYGPIKRNAARCKSCEETVSSVHRHDYAACGCGAIAVDGGSWYLRRVVKEGADYEDLSIRWPDEIEGGKHDAD